MSQTFGARLRQRREEQHIALSTIAAQTKIKCSLLDALERDDLSQWPAGLYRRAFIRAYARAIGLDPDVIVRELDEAHPEPAQLAAARAAAEGAETNGGATTGLRRILGSTLSRLRRNSAADEPPAAPMPPQPTLHDRDAFGERRDLDDLQLPDPVGTEPEPVRAIEAVPAAAADLPAASETPAAEPPHFEPDLPAIARLCTQFCRVENPDDVRPLLQEAARILHANGLVVWVWDETADGLRAVLSHGYSDRVLAQLPAVRRDDDNATAAAFRTAHVRATQGALVLPLIAPGGCGGVLAIELPDGREQAKSVRAVATIFAALLAQLVVIPQPADAQPGPESRVAPADDLHHEPVSYKPAAMTH